MQLLKVLLNHLREVSGDTISLSLVVFAKDSQILDVEVYMVRKKKWLVFKIDFQKAYITVLG